MPAPFEILRLLAQMARELGWLALAWHLVVAGVAAALAITGRAPSRGIALLLALLASSVAVGSFVYENPFNGASFLVLALLLALLGQRLSGAASSSGWQFALGAFLLVFGLCYPHFVTPPWYRALYAGPVGVIPCPTLAVISGCLLMAGGFGSRAIPATVAVWTTFYALFGIFRLGVTLDVGLLAASLGLCLTAVTPVRAARVERSALKV